MKWISPEVSANCKVNSTKIWVSEQFASLIYLLNMKESENHSVVSDSLTPHGLFSPWNCAGQNIGGGSLSLLQGIFPTQGSNSGLPHCRRILYLSHKGCSLSKPSLKEPTKILYSLSPCSLAHIQWVMIQSFSLEIL